MTTSDSSPSRWWQRQRNLLTGLALMLAAWVLYLPTVKYGFIYYDDVRILQDHPELYGQASLAADLKAIFMTCFPREEPLLVRDVTWALDSRLFGFDNPFGYHLTNVLLHGVEVALMFAFLLGTTRRYGLALGITFAYLALAVHMEPVAWIMGRKDLLSAIFMLLALGAQTRRLTTEKPAARTVWYLATLFCFVAGLLSKISVLTFPLVLFLHAVLLPYLRGDQPPNGALQWRRVLREALLAAPGLAISGIIYVWYQRTLAQMGVFDRGYSAHGLAHLWNLLMVNPLGFWLYLRQIFFPFHLALYYPWPALETAYPLWQKLLALATVAAAIGTGGWMFCRRKDLFFYMAAFFVLMIPYLNLLYIGIWVADRYVYFSSFCVLALTGTVAAAAWKRFSRNLQLAMVTVGIGLTANNFYQALSYQPAWRDGETLWQYHLTLPGHPAAAYENLAAFYYAGFSDAVARQDKLRAAATLNKMKVVVEAGLTEFWPDRRQSPPAPTFFLFFLESLIQEVNGEPEMAVANLLMADRLHPDFDSTQLNLSRLYHKLAQTAKSSRERETNLRAARDRFAAYLKLVYRDRPPTPEAQREMAELEAKCAALPPLPIGSVPAKP